VVREVIVIAKLGDPLGEQAIEVAKQACLQALREHGVKAVVVPMVSWSSSSLTRGPITIVNGRVIAFGRVPRLEEVLEALLNPPRGRRGVRAFTEVPAAIIDDSSLLSAAEVASQSS